MTQDPGARAVPLRDWALIFSCLIGAGLVGSLIGVLSIVFGFADLIVLSIYAGAVLFAAGGLFWMGMLTRRHSASCRRKC
jgi:hypothetical protein